jgi:transcriptional regulator with XRE-family HTH domain
MSETPLHRLREAAGLSMQALADLVGTSAAQINKLEKGERRMTLDWMTRLAHGLGVEIEALLPAQNRHPAGMSTKDALGAGTPFVPRPSASDPNDLIPVRSAARGGDEQEMFLQDGPIDFIRRPPSLQHVRDAYSIYMVGDSMNPRFRQGQLLHVNPFPPAAAGCRRGRHDPGKCRTDQGVRASHRRSAQAPSV